MQRLAGNRTVVRQLQRDEPLDDTAGPALVALVEKLQTAIATAEELAAQADETPPVAELRERLDPLAEIAHGGDETSKVAALAAVRADLAEVDLIPPTEEPTRGGTIQRVGVRTRAVAAAIGAAVGAPARRVQGYIRLRRDAALYADYRRRGIHPPIPAELEAGLDAGTPAEKAARLFENVNHFPFRYTGWAVAPVTAMYSHEGDCQTLVRIYRTVARAHGIRTDLGQILNRVLVDARPIHGRNAQANTDGNTHWCFGEHYWVVAEGTEYDLLFMNTPRPPAIVKIGRGGPHQGVYYDTFPGGLVLIRPQRGAPIRGAGKVFASEAEAHRFLDAHRVLVGGELAWRRSLLPRFTR
jgi:hypothetical protein